MLQYIVLALQIVLLAVSWVLFQQAKTELNAKAAEMPVLTEVQALHDRVKQLLGELERTAEREADKLASECSRAETLLAAMQVAAMQGVCGPVSANSTPEAIGNLEALDDVSTLTNPSYLSGRQVEAQGIESGQDTDHAIVAKPQGNSVNRGSGNPMSRREAIIRLAMKGESSAAIARTLGVSEGEVETVVGLLRS